MASQETKPARTIAMMVLNRFDPERNYAGAILNDLIIQTNERQRATDLVFGTIRNRSAIDMVITKFGNCPVERIDAGLLNIIRIAVYELVYQPQAAEYAIVNEAVENARALAGKKQVGFVNAVLRQITRQIQNRQAALTEAEVTKVLPQTSSCGCAFDSDLLPRPEKQPADYLSTVFSLPKWLVAEWLAEFGEEKTRQVCFAGNRRPGIYARPNGLKTTVGELAEKFAGADIDFEIAEGSLLKIKGSRVVTELPGFGQGLFSVQDITAWRAVELLEPQAGWTILDMCAAPGTKTMQLAEVTGDKAKIIATDIDAKRLEMVKDNVERLGIGSVNIAAYEKLKDVVAEAGPFDSVLLDVPCSNTGVLAKRIEVRYRITPKAIEKLAKTQLRLLNTAVSMIRQGGKICYSTCSIQRSENGELVRKFLRARPDFELQSEQLTLPSAHGFDCDGGYAAILTRS